MDCAQRLAAILRSRVVKPVDVVAVTIKNCPEAPTSFQAAWILGAAIARHFSKGNSELRPVKHKTPPFQVGSFKLL